MTSSKNLTWTFVNGAWDKKNNKLSQVSLDGATRTYFDFKESDYILETSFKIIEGNDSEAKIIFSNADQNEDYRIDFMSNSNLCRITVEKHQFVQIMSIEENKIYDVSVIVKSNYLSVIINGLEIFNNIQFGKKSDGIIGLGTYQAKVEFTDTNISKFEIKSCFVIMPFDQKRDFLYEDTICRVLNNHKKYSFSYIRADKMLTTGKITEEIDDKIINSDLIIADITIDNNNVYFELGIAHANNKKVILLKEKIGDEKMNLPFDIKDFRTHPYIFSRDGLNDLGTRLNEIIINILE